MTAEATVAKRLDGKIVGAAIRASLPPKIQAFTASAGRPPGLGIVLAGHDGGSETYVRNKMKACAELGVHAVLERLSDEGSRRARRSHPGYGRSTLGHCRRCPV